MKKYPMLFSASLLMFFMFNAVFAKGPESYFNGINQFNKGKLDDAIKSFNGAIKEDATNINAYFMLGLVQIQKGEFASAEINLKIFIDNENSHKNAEKYNSAITNYLLVQQKLKNWDVIKNYLVIADDTQLNNYDEIKFRADVLLLIADARNETYPKEELIKITKRVIGLLESIQEKGKTQKWYYNSLGRIWLNDQSFYPDEKSQFEALKNVEEYFGNEIKLNDNCIAYFNKSIATRLLGEHTARKFNRSFQSEGTSSSNTRKYALDTLAYYKSALDVIERANTAKECEKRNVPKIAKRIVSHKNYVEEFENRREVKKSLANNLH